MRSMKMVDFGADLEERFEDDPVPQGGEILLKVTSCGVCHSDLHIWGGTFDLGDGKVLDIRQRMTMPFTMGHEPLGEVLACGPDVRGINVGESYIAYPWIGCGTCSVCLDGHELLCLAPRTIGTRQQGGYADRVIVPDAKYLVAYDGINEELACTYACSGITAYSALNKCKEVGLGASDHVLIVGAGGVGLNGVSMFKGICDAQLIVADLDDTKLDLARDAGADHVLNNGNPDAMAELLELTGGGAAAAVDFVGAPSSAQFAINGLRKGGTAVIVGLFGGAISLPLATLPLQMRSIRGSYVGTLQDLKEVVALAQAGKIKPLPVTPRPLGEVNDVLRDLQAGKIQGRVVLKP